MKIFFMGFVAIAFALLNVNSAFAQCLKDTDCKGERICENGECVSPPPAAQPAPAVQPAPAAQPAPAVQPAPAAQPAPATQPAPAELGQAVEVKDELVDDKLAYVGYIEWASLRAGGGNYGASLSFSLFTLRWRWFYWTILNIGGGGGANGGNDTFDIGYYGKAGTRIGFPLHLGRGGRHELRLGLGASGGIIEIQGEYTAWGEWRTWMCTSHGPFLDIELLYQFHIKKRLAILAGYEGAIVFTWVDHYGRGYWEPPGLHFAFVGVAF